MPFRPRCRRTRSFAVVATKSVSTFPKGRVAPEAGEWFVNGNEAIVSAAATGVG